MSLEQTNKQNKQILFSLFGINFIIVNLCYDFSEINFCLYSRLDSSIDNYFGVKYKSCNANQIYGGKEL